MPGVKTTTALCDCKVRLHVSEGQRVSSGQSVYTIVKFHEGMWLDLMEIKAPCAGVIAIEPGVNEQTTFKYGDRILSILY